jgi:hypothetical protein
MAEESQVISFRLSAVQLAALKQAAAVKNESAGECAKALVIGGLQGGTASIQSEVLSQTVVLLTSIEEELLGLRETMGTVERDSFETAKGLRNLTGMFRKATLATLYGAGQIPLEEAQKWCDENLSLEGA